MTLTSDFCTAAFEDAIDRYGAPEIFNTDQGSPFTSIAFVDVLRRHHIQISMDGSGCWRDHDFVERLWRSVKYEDVYVHACETVSAVRAGLKRYFTFFNQRRPLAALDGRTPNQAYRTSRPNPSAVSSRANVPKRAA